MSFVQKFFFCFVFFPLHCGQSFCLPLGSSAGAGSEVFHVYRHLRRRENIRVQHIDEAAEKEDLDDAFQERLVWNKLVAEQRTSKKRAKR